MTGILIPDPIKFEPIFTANVPGPDIDHFCKLEFIDTFKRRLLATAELLDELQSSTSKTAKFETGKSNVNVTSPVCISLTAIHYE
uniref:Uncharacterized protein n=2 Tax=Onchocerca ochengi TaxID=42157 RepID=A0A182EY10_ONCOC